MRYFLLSALLCSLAVSAQPNLPAPSYPSPPANPQAYPKAPKPYARQQNNYYAPRQQYPLPPGYRQHPPQYQAPPNYRQQPQQYQAPPPNYRQQPQQYQRQRQAPPSYNARRNTPPPYYAPRPYPPRGYYPPRKKKKSRFGFGSFNPKKSMSDMWDDGWKAPSKWGKMPGGWNFPDISLPNPVDSADDFQKGIKDIPKGFNQN